MDRLSFLDVNPEALMTMEHSDFENAAGKIGIGEMMDDLGNALIADPAPSCSRRKPQSHIPPVKPGSCQAHGSHARPIRRIRTGDRKHDTPAEAKRIHRVFGPELFRSPEFGWRGVGPGNSP